MQWAHLKSGSFWWEEKNTIREFIISVLSSVLYKADWDSESLSHPQTAVSQRTRLPVWVCLTDDGWRLIHKTGKKIINPTKFLSKPNCMYDNCIGVWFHKSFHCKSVRVLHSQWVVNWFASNGAGFQYNLLNICLQTGVDWKKARADKHLSRAELLWRQEYCDCFWVENSKALSSSYHSFNLKGGRLATDAEIPKLKWQHGVSTSPPLPPSQWGPSRMRGQLCAFSRTPGRLLLEDVNKRASGVCLGSVSFVQVLLYPLNVR